MLAAFRAQAEKRLMAWKILTIKDLLVILPPLRGGDLGRELAGYRDGDRPQRVRKSAARDCADCSGKHFGFCVVCMWC